MPVPSSMRRFSPWTTAGSIPPPRPVCTAAAWLTLPLDLRSYPRRSRRNRSRRSASDSAEADEKANRRASARRSAWRSLSRIRVVEGVLGQVAQFLLDAGQLTPEFPEASIGRRMPAHTPSSDPASSTQLIERSEPQGSSHQAIAQRRPPARR